MKLEDQVVSLELAKRLKEIGVKQESAFYWFEGVNEIGLVDRAYAWPPKEKHTAAFTVAELGEMLPQTFIDKSDDGQYFAQVNIFKQYSNWAICYETSKRRVCTAEMETEADARAKMLIYLIEQGIVKP